jgi:hypothetical protein
VPAAFLLGSTNWVLTFLPLYLSAPLMTGSAMSLGASVLPIFEQLGMLDELKTFAKPCYTAEVYDHKISKLGFFDMRGLEKL